MISIPGCSAYWLVIDHQYGAITDERGEFTLSDLPVGRHTLRVWHERAGWLSKSLTVEIQADETLMLDPLEVSPDSMLR